MALKPKEHFHGSDLEKIEAVYGIKKEDIISFSANVNPLGVSFRLKETLTNHIDAITTYPDREYTSLRKCIADYVHTNYKNIVVGNGSTELISPLYPDYTPDEGTDCRPNLFRIRAGSRNGRRTLPLLQPHGSQRI